MNINPNAVAKCLENSSETLLNIAQYLRDNEGDNQVINGIGCVQASIYTLQMIFGGVDGRPEVEDLTGVRIKPPRYPADTDIADVQDDNPDIEDRDLKKASEDSRGFFGR